MKIVISAMGSSLIGKKPGIIDASLHLLLQIPHYIPEQKKFELGVLVRIAFFPQLFHIFIHLKHNFNICLFCFSHYRY